MCSPEETFDQFKYVLFVIEDGFRLRLPSISTNVFGALNVTRAFLPYMREKRTGTVIFAGSIGGWRYALFCIERFRVYNNHSESCQTFYRSGPYAGIYATSKWALRGKYYCSNCIMISTDQMTGISKTLHDEISPLGLRSICIDFGYFRTSFLEADNRAPRISRIPDYQEICNTVESALNGMRLSSRHGTYKADLFQPLMEINLEIL